MTRPDRSSGLEDNEVLIYVRERGGAPGSTPRPRRPSSRCHGNRPFARSRSPTTSSTGSAARSAGSPAGSPTRSDVDERFAVDLVTLHVGLTASGTFVWASAGVEVAVDVTWRRTRSARAEELVEDLGLVPVRRQVAGVGPDPEPSRSGARPRRAVPPTAARCGRRRCATR